MDSNHHILIVEDHPITARAYKNILETFQKNNPSYRFTIDLVFTIDNALKKLETGQVYDLALLDISLPLSSHKKLTTGDALGSYLKEILPEVKLLVITMFSDAQHISQIFKRISPEGYLVKSDLDAMTLTDAVVEIFRGGVYYSKSVSMALKKSMSRHEILDTIDIKILQELANGAKMRDLITLLHLTKSGIERRKRKLKSVFEIETNNDRDLVLKARAKGFI